MDNPIDFSLLDELKELDLSHYETTTPGYLEDYARRLIEARFSQEFCFAECYRLHRWYDIVRLARHTRRTYSDYKALCLASQPPLPLPPEPDTVGMLLLAPRIDPQGTPEAKDLVIMQLIDLCQRCRELLDQEEDDSHLELLPGEEPLSLLIPNGRRRRRLMKEAAECHTGREFVARVLELALRKEWLTWAQCRRQEVRKAFFPFLPGDAKNFSKGNLNYHMDDKLSMYKPKA